MNNSMAKPKIEKVVLNMGIKEALVDKKVLDTAASMLSQISGLKPRINRAKKSIATFKLRTGDPIGLMVTMRGKRMNDFLKKLISVVLPRVRDFHGVKASSFDGKGNYSMGFRETLMFPEIDPAKLDKMMGIEVTITTTAENDDEGRKLLEGLGMPFAKRSG